MRWTEKLTAFNFNIKYHKDKLNFTNASLRRSDIMKLNDSKKNNDFFYLLCKTNFAIRNVNLSC